MKIIIAGSRTIKDYELVEAACAEYETEFGKITEVVSGGARGVDKLGERWAEEHLGKDATVIKADWKDKLSPTYSSSLRYDPAAGRRRNWKMAQLAVGLVAVRSAEKKSSGTDDMIRTAKKLGLMIVLKDLRKQEEPQLRLIA